MWCASLPYHCRHSVIQFTFTVSSKTTLYKIDKIFQKQALLFNFKSAKQSLLQVFSCSNKRNILNFLKNQKIRFQEPYKLYCINTVVNFQRSKSKVYHLCCVCLNYYFDAPVPLPNQRQNKINKKAIKSM